MLNYEVDPGLLREYVPDGTELDYWNGKTFASLVGFRFLNTRVLGLKIPFHRNFDEVNLRFYVRRENGTESRRGVVFIREIVPRWAIAVIARIFYNERYVACPMNHIIQSDSSGITATYRWKFGANWNTISVAALGKAELPEADSLEQFITEHYWGYAQAQEGRCIEYRVQHPQWLIWNTTKAEFAGDATPLYGKKWETVLSRQPSSAFLAEGSEVAVYRKTIYR